MSHKSTRPSWESDGSDAHGKRYRGVLLEDAFYFRSVVWTCKCKRVHRSIGAAEYCAGRKQRKSELDRHFGRPRSIA